MKPGIIAALVASVILIGSALYVRFDRQSAPPSLVALNNEKLPDEYYSQVVSNFLGASSTSAVAASTPSTNNEPLTTTDLVGRQLILDYVGLIQAGDTSAESFSNLADRYSDSIPGIVSVNKLTLLDLHVVSNTNTNFTAYSQALGSAYSNYASQLVGSYSSNNVTLSASSIDMFKKMSRIYQQIGDSLKAMSVPSDVSSLHLELTNIYLENAINMGALGDAQSDPAASLAGLIAYRSNAAAEQEVILKIQKILSDHGV